MISATITADPKDSRRVLVEITGPLQNRRGLNAVLAQRLAGELQNHFRAKNAQPNKRGWKKTNFWAQLGRATSVGTITDDSATVTVADARYRIHLFGGTIKPTGGRKYLTIPLVEEARGLNPASYERKTGRELFQLGHSKVLAEKRYRGGSQSLIGPMTGRRYRNGTASDVTLEARQQVRVVYALAPKAVIKADPTAFPPMPDVLSALTEEAGDFLDREMRKGGSKK